MARYRPAPGAKAAGLVSFCQGATLWVASRHGKERPLARALGRLGLHLRAPDDLDTDRFGTFTGEVERTLDPTAAAHAKIALLRDYLGPVPAIATEGSFGPHPMVPFLAYHREVLVFSDLGSGLDLVLTRAGRASNFAQAEFDRAADPTEFLNLAGYPAAALIIRPAGLPPGPGLAKGVCDRSIFWAAWANAAALSPTGRVLVETDMRAHLNPLRRQVLARLGADLARRLTTPCPDCGRVGFGFSVPLPGLACRDCGTPTSRPRLNRFSCSACGGFRDLPVPGALAGADPGQCPTCNP